MPTDSSHVKSMLASNPEQLKRRHRVPVASSYLFVLLEARVLSCAFVKARQPKTESVGFRVDGHLTRGQKCKHASRLVQVRPYPTWLVSNHQPISKLLCGGMDR
uniref:Uncharacterized protein n=1 Tax=Panagrellus redivivus TaxID=6233 RepID=A0A7E4UQJ8_PANRE